MNRPLKIAFLASLLGNVLLLGVLLGEVPHRLGPESFRDRDGRMSGPRMEKVLGVLPDPVQAEFRERMERARQEDEPRRAQIQAARARAIQILTAEPFDEAAYDREVNEIDALRTQRSMGMAQIVKEVARDLPRGQRQVLAELLNRPPPPPPPQR